jgi:hypothetical protein
MYILERLLVGGGRREGERDVTKMSKENETNFYLRPKLQNL